MATHIKINRVPLADYWVVARHCKGCESLGMLAENASQPAFSVKAFCDVLESSSRRDGIISVQTEKWVGFLTRGDWWRLTPRDGEF